MMSKQNIKPFYHAAAGLIIILFWWLVACVVQLPVIPSPFSVMQRLQEIFISDIAVHSLYSFLRIASGLLAAIIVGYPVGIIAGYYPKMGMLLSPLIYLAYPIPKVALLPIIMLLFGVGEVSKLLLVFFIVVFQIIIAVRDSVHFIPEESFAVLYSLGAPFIYVLKNIIFPASLPKFFSSLRVAMATAISVLFFTETFGTQIGMGYFIMDAWLRVNYIEMYCGIVVLSIMGITIFAFIDLGEKHFCPWQSFGNN